MTGRLPLLALVLGGAGWPFRLPHSGDGGLVVRPDSGIHRVAAGPASTEELTYSLHNATDGEIALEVAEKTCQCMAVDLTDRVLPAWSGTTVRVTVLAPLAGEVSGAVLPRARSLGDVEQSASTLVLLEHTVEVRQNAPLEVRPPRARVSQGDRGPQALLFTAVAQGLGRPRSLSLVQEETRAPTTCGLLTDWEDVGAGRFSALLDVNVAPRDWSQGSLVLTFRVHGEGGGSVDAKVVVEAE